MKWPSWSLSTPSSGLEPPLSGYPIASSWGAEMKMCTCRLAETGTGQGEESFKQKECYPPQNEP